MSTNAAEKKLAIGPRLIRAWFRYVWTGRSGTLTFLVVLSVVNALVLTAVPWLWQYVIDEVRGAANPDHILEIGLWLCLVGVGQSVVYMALQGTRTVMNARIQWRARERLTDHVIHAPKRFYRTWRAGDVVTRIADDAGEKTSWFLGSGIFRTLEALLIVAVCFSAMMVIDPELTLWVCLPLPLLIIGQAMAQSALEPRFRAVQTSISDLNDDIASTFGGIRVVQGSGLENTAMRRFSDLANRQRRAEIRATVLQQAIFLMYGYGWQLAVVALLLAGGGRVLDGAISLGEYIAFEGFLMTLVWPMFDFGMFVSRYKQAGVALERLQEVIESSVDDEANHHGGGEPSGHETQLPAPGTIVIDAATVTAEDGATLLDDIQLRTTPGTRVALVGEVGAGKSTLMQLLAGARRAARGSVLVATAQRDTDAAYVPQDPVILSTTVRENILLGRDADEAALTRALDVSRLAQDLAQLPDGLDTEVGERGVTLSGGQQQRVALARALVVRPSVLLLDDATAALDADTEAAFWRELHSAHPEATAVVVTHRIATIERADQVVVLDGGRIVQRGQHADLVSEDGPYRRIYGRYLAEERINAPSNPSA